MSEMFSEEWRREVVRKKLITGQMIDIKRRNIVGLCHCNTHKGNLTKSLMLDHKCIEKQCPFFQKNEYATYWIGADDKKARRQKARQKAKERKRLLRGE